MEKFPGQKIFKLYLHYKFLLHAEFCLHSKRMRPIFNAKALFFLDHPFHVDLRTFFEFSKVFRLCLSELHKLKLIYNILFQLLIFRFGATSAEIAKFIVRKVPL